MGVMFNYILTESRIGHAQVIVDILPKGKVIPNTIIKPTSITLHNTGNIGASASNNHRYMANLNKNGGRSASWHFTVDDQFIYQAIPTNRKAWHAGCASGNNTSIGIEICMFNDANRQKKCYENAIALVKILMAFHGFTTNLLKRHYDWTKKDCPTWLISGKFGYTWNWFKQACVGSTPQVPQEPSNPTQFKPYLARCKTNNLNCRKGAGTSFAVERQINTGTVITIVEEKVNGSTKWGKSASGYWVSLAYMEFVRYV
jgi:N-acetylmuramoyl-L-alanine amidase CwlA